MSDLIQIHLSDVVEYDSTDIPRIEGLILFILFRSAQKELWLDDEEIGLLSNLVPDLERDLQ
jgi:hypothetical protein